MTPPSAIVTVPSPWFATATTEAWVVGSPVVVSFEPAPVTLSVPLAAANPPRATESSSSCVPPSIVTEPAVVPPITSRALHGS